ncbi:MAG: hypothetical protein NPIRA04_20470 [Nitrospirales bacterium]|nr:MAG: hypothetical protein NPIRA04_20470 [Nitrospirales bacterium]
MNRLRAHCLILIQCFVLLGAVPAFSEEFSGKVVSVSDGDALSVMRNGKSKKVRLKGIDCPEQGQAFSRAAKRFVSDVAFKKEVTVQGM